MANRPQDDGDADGYSHDQEHLALEEVEFSVADLLLLLFPFGPLEEDILAFIRESDLLTGPKPARLVLM